MPPRRKGKRVVAKKRGGLLKYAVGGGPLGRPPKKSNMMLTKEDFERMARMRNANPNARRKYRRKQLNYAQLLGQPLPRKAHV